MRVSQAEYPGADGGVSGGHRPFGAERGKTAAPHQPRGQIGRFWSRCPEGKGGVSYDDLAIQRGLRMVYHHRRIDRKLFEKYRRRFHPYCSVASLYLWAVAGGAIPEMKDYAPKNNRRKEK